MRSCDHIFDVGLVRRRTAFNGIFACVRGVDAASIEKLLRWIRFGVYSDVYFILFFRGVPLLGTVAVYYVFRLASARQRIAVKGQNQPLGGVRDEGVMV